MINSNADAILIVVIGVVVVCCGGCYKFINWMVNTSDNAIADSTTTDDTTQPVIPREPSISNSLTEFEENV